MTADRPHHREKSPARASVSGPVKHARRELGLRTCCFCGDRGNGVWIGGGRGRVVRIVAGGFLLVAAFGMAFFSHAWWWAVPALAAGLLMIRAPKPYWVCPNCRNPYMPC